MSQNLLVDGFSNLNKLARTTLTADITTAVTGLPVTNSNDFSAGGPILVGAPGSSNPELLTATAPSNGTAIPVSATTLQHNNGDPVILLFGSQINVYSAPDSASLFPGTGQQPPDTAFNLIADSPFDIDANKSQTAVSDPAGVAGTWYKFTYLNSASSSETSLADARAYQAGVTHYASLDEVRSAAGLTGNVHVTDAKIAEFRDAAEREINGALLPVYAFPLSLPTNPIVVEIAKNIAAGELKHELYQNVSIPLAKDGEDKASKARNGGGSHTSLSELVDRTIVLEDAEFNELTIEEAHAFGGYPDGTGEHDRPQFRIDELY